MDRSEDNYVFEISQFYKPIRRWLLENDVIFPKHYLPLALQYLDFDETLSISRDRKRLEWGIAVPHDHTQTIYVWMDALMNYLTVSGFPNSHYEYWPPTWQVIGKDILNLLASIPHGRRVAATPKVVRARSLARRWCQDVEKHRQYCGSTHRGRNINS
uniref:Methionyl-tRNA synthetase n=1 Tax=Ascaris suum TaxID=6253 RepID=F1LE61_ASCSU